MRIEQLEHLIRAAGAIAQTKRLIVIGSQAILASFPDAPAELLRSQEADLYPPDDPAQADLIDGSIGEGSPFHRQFGYYAHGIGPETAVLPAHWESRLVSLRNEITGGIRALCLSPADLAVSKIIAGRDNDLNYTRTLLNSRLVRAEEIVKVLPELTVEQRELVEMRLRQIQR